MKFFVTGVGGQLGHDVMNELLKRGHEGVGSDIQENYSGVTDGSAVTKAPYIALDITDKDAVEKVITEVNPDAVIHCAAWTAVDMAEDDDKIAKVRAINAGGTQNIADVCKKLDCKMTYISTDYVFDGQGTEPWQPDCKDYKPLNVYGQTKLEGELAVSQTLEKYFIVRIAWVFGLNGKNFIKTIENVIMMVPFTSMVIWTFQEKMGSSWKKILWYSGKIAFIFSISIEVLQLFLRLGTFQLSDLFYNTVGGMIGGLMYYGITKAKKHL